MYVAAGRSDRDLPVYVEFEINLGDVVHIVLSRGYITKLYPLIDSFFCEYSKTAETSADVKKSNPQVSLFRRFVLLYAR